MGKKAREDFFLGKELSPGSQPENSPLIARPTSLPIKLEKDSSNQGSPTSDKEPSSTASTISRHIKRFVGQTRPNERFRQSFTENLVEDEENDDSEWSIEGEG